MNTLRQITENEEQDFIVVKRLIMPGSTAVDIGANVGTYTTFLSRLSGPSGHVFAVEPIPETFEVLCFAVKHLPLNNVSVMQFAVSDSIGKTSMAIPSYETGGRNYYQARIISTDAGQEAAFTNIPTQTLDALFLKHASEISFIKIDVEGHELAVIEGAAQLLASSSAAWLLELSSDPDDPASAAHRLCDIFVQAGYDMYWFDGKKLHRRGCTERSINYFFLKNEHLRQLSPELYNGPL